MHEIKHAQSFERECGAADGHGGRCVKDVGHVDDPTDDDHGCCCGHTWEDG